MSFHEQTLNGQSFSRYLLSSTNKNSKSSSSGKNIKANLDQNESLLLQTTEFITKNSQHNLKTLSDVKPPSQSPENMEKDDYSDLFGHLEITLSNIGEENSAKSIPKPSRQQFERVSEKEVQHREDNIDELKSICQSLLVANKELLRKMNKIEQENTQKLAQGPLKSPRFLDPCSSQQNGMKLLSSVESRVKNSIQTQLPCDSIKQKAPPDARESLRYEQVFNVPSKYITQEMEFILNEYKAQINSLKEELSQSKLENKQTSKTLQSYKQEIKFLKKEVKSLQVHCQELKLNNSDLKEKLIRSLKEKSRAELVLEQKQKVVSPNKKSPNHFEYTASFGDLNETKIKECPFESDRKVNIGGNQRSPKPNSYKSEWGSPLLNGRKASTYQNLSQLEKHCQRHHQDRQKLKGSKSPSQTPCPVPNYIKFKNKLAEESDQMDRVRVRQNADNKKTQIKIPKGSAPYVILKETEVGNPTINERGSYHSPSSRKNHVRSHSQSANHMIHQICSQENQRNAINIQCGDESLNDSSSIPNQDELFQKYVTGCPNSGRRFSSAEKKSKKNKNSQIEKILEIDSDDGSSIKTQKISANPSNKKCFESGLVGQEQVEKESVEEGVSKKTNLNQTVSTIVERHKQKSKHQKVIDCSSRSGLSDSSKVAKVLKSFREITEMQQIQAQKTQYTHKQSQSPLPLSYKSALKEKEEQNMRVKDIVNGSHLFGDIHFEKRRYFTSAASRHRNEHETSLGKRIRTTHG